MVGVVVADPVADPRAAQKAWFPEEMRSGMILAGADKRLTRRLALWTANVEGRRRGSNRPPQGSVVARADVAPPPMTQTRDAGRQSPPPTKLAVKLHNTNKGKFKRAKNPLALLQVSTLPFLDRMTFFTSSTLPIASAPPHHIPAITAIC